MHRLGLRMVQPDELIWRRRRSGRRFGYLDECGRLIRNARDRERLARLAVPPAYEDVRYAPDPRAHIQAVGRDAAGRLQYRYHPEWEKVREQDKARRLLRLVAALPKTRRAIARYLAGREPTREFAAAAVIELIAQTALRPGSDTYLRRHGTRGAVTLLKSNVRIARGCLLLAFTGKGGKKIVKRCNARRLERAVDVLRGLPGRRLFQYHGDDDKVHPLRRRQVNEFLRAISNRDISLKDLRTLHASAAVMEQLAAIEPAPGKAVRRRQVLRAVRATADDLVNTPAICRRSYVHEAVVNAFETGKLRAHAAALKRSRSPARRERILARVLAAEMTS